MAKTLSGKNTHPLAISAQTWMNKRGWIPASFQLQAWKAYENGQSGLVNAPTGSGKTYSLMLPILLEMAASSNKPIGLTLLWITPIRALAKEIKLAAQRVIDSENLSIHVGIRTGDTSDEEKASQRTKMPQVLITTPESLHLLLARKGSTELLGSLKALVVDEWHELLGNKRGVMMELAISHLKAVSKDLRIWGISATIGNLQEAMHVLLGSDKAEFGSLIRSEIKKNIEVISLFPNEVERLPWAGHLGVKMIDKVIPVVHQAQSCLIFTNTRAQCEIWYKALLENDPELAGNLAMHHGSLSRDTRAWVEEALYDGRVKAVVCTSSLDLGVDFAPVDTIIQIGGPKGIARFIQRAGRSGHRPDAVSTIYFLPTHSLELIEAAALRQAVSDSYLEEKTPLTRCFDVLAQYMVTLSLGDGWTSDQLYQEIRSTTCFDSVSSEEWNWMVRFLTNGGVSLQAYEDYQRLMVVDDVYKIRSPRLARRHRLSIGTIVSDTMVAIKWNRGGLIGHVEESFIASIKEGDAFWFAGQGFELLRVKELTAYVKKSEAKNGKIPSYQGGRMPLSSRMSDMLRRKLTEAADLPEGAEIELQYIQPLIELQKKRSMVPKEDELLIELFETKDGYHAVFYTFEGRFVNEGLASLFAFRIGESTPISCSLAYNDYGFELLSDIPIPVEEALGDGLLDTYQLEQDVTRGVNSAELARRRFREIAAISGLVFKGYPGKAIRDRHLQSSAALLFNVFEDYDPHNLLLRQSYDEVVEYQLEMPRLRKALVRMSNQKIHVIRPEKPTPFAFPIMVDRLREKMSSETLESRVAKLTIDFLS
jgi:ATP-dependent helicase Lhr and Lhr-like helicase